MKKFVMAVIGKSNSLALVGGLINILAFFLPLYELHLQSRGVAVSAAKDVRITAVSAFRLVQAGEINLIAALLNWFFSIVGACALFGSFATALFAFRKQDKASIAALIIGLTGGAFLLRYIIRGPWLFGLDESGFSAPWTFGLGFYLLAVGVICLLFSGITTYIPAQEPPSRTL